MKNILLTAFGIKVNSSKILLDKIKLNVDKVIFQNDFIKSEIALLNKLESNYYNYIISFGQKPLTKSIYIETKAIRKDKKLSTNFDYIKLSEFLSNKGYKFKISNNAGTSLCNNIYYEGLNYISSKDLKIKMIFIHVPYLKNINDINELANDITEFLLNLLNE